MFLFLVYYFLSSNHMQSYKALMKQDLISVQIYSTPAFKSGSDSKVEELTLSSRAFFVFLLNLMFS